MYSQVINNTQKKLKLITKNGKTHILDLSKYQFVSSLRANEQETMVAFTAVENGQKSANVFKDTIYKGDFKLFSYDLETGETKTLYKKYAHDAVWSPVSGEIAFYSGNALCTANTQTNEIKKHISLGQFSFGSPSISWNTDGTLLSCVKWESSDKRITTYDLVNKNGTVHNHSCSEYHWFDTHTILFQKYGNIKLLNISNSQLETMITINQIQKLIGVQNKVDSSYNEIKLKAFFNNRIFLVYSDREIMQFISVNKEMTDTQILYESKALSDEYLLFPRVSYLGDGNFEISKIRRNQEASLLSKTVSRVKRFISKDEPETICLTVDGGIKIPTDFFLLPDSSTPNFGHSFWLFAN